MVDIFRSMYFSLNHNHIPGVETISFIVFFSRNMIDFEVKPGTFEVLQLPTAGRYLGTIGSVTCDILSNFDVYL